VNTSLALLSLWLAQAPLDGAAASAPAPDVDTAAASRPAVDVDSALSQPAPDVDTAEVPAPASAAASQPSSSPAAVSVVEAVPADAAAQPASQPESAPGSAPATVARTERTDAKPWYGGSVTLDTSVGTGGLVLEETARNPYVASMLALAPLVRFKILDHPLQLRARWDLGWEFTAPDTPTGRRWEIYDPRLSLVDDAVFEWHGLSANLAAGLTLPVSFESWQASLICAVDAGAGLGYEIQGASLEYGILARKYLNYRVVSAVPEYARPLVRGNLDVLGSANRSARLIHQFTASYGFPMLEGLPGLSSLAVTLDFWILNDFSYDIVPDDDPYTAPHAKKGGGREDWLWTTLDVSYAPLDWFTVSTGLTALHPAVDQSTENLIFPLFGAMDSLAADNYASVYLDFILSY
jgi:hypothetical protein